jgi:hypothetical protein
MNALLLSSAGFPIESLSVPAFQLHKGECVCLHLPQRVDSAEAEQLIRALTGKIPLPGVRLFGQVHWVAPLSDRREGLSGIFRSMRVADWLSRSAGAQPSQAQIILQRLPPSERDCRIEQLAGTARLVLSMEAAWLAGADVVVFSAAGLDPLGREAVFEAVFSHLPQGGAIHLSFPFLQDGQWRRECFTGTTCLELRGAAEAPLSVTILPRTR